MAKFANLKIAKLMFCENFMKKVLESLGKVLGHKDFFHKQTFLSISNKSFQEAFQPLNTQ